MDEKTVIKYLDKLVNEYIKDDLEVFMISDFLKEDKEHLSERKDQAESYKLADNIENFGLKKNLFKPYKGHLLSLSEKGIELRDLKKGYLKFVKKDNFKEDLEIKLAKSNLQANKINKKIAKKNTANEKFNRISTIINIIIGALNIGLLIWQLSKAE